MLKKTISITFLFLIIVAGCSQGGKPSVTPDLTGNTVSELPLASQDSNTHAFSGAWDVQFDLESLEASVNPLREAETHYNVTSVFPAPFVEITSWDPSTAIVSVQVSLHCPVAITLYDVRLIIYTDNYGHRLINCDDWTSLYDIAGGYPINPFFAYKKDIADRKFEPYLLHSENLQIFLPGGNPNVKFAIDVSYPGNCREPYSIGNYQQGLLYDYQGASCSASVDVLDWGSNASSVKLYCPTVFGNDLLDMTKDSDFTWSASIANNTGVDSGEYNAYVIAMSSDSGTLALYDEVKVTVTYCPSDIGWGKSWGAIGHEYGRDVVCSSSGDFYVLGTFTSTVDFDPGEGVVYRTPTGSDDLYLSKFNACGEFQWVDTWGNLDQYDMLLGKIHIDSADNIVIMGYFEGTVDFNPGSGLAYETSSGYQSAFICKISSAGDFISVVTFGGDEYVYVNGSGLDQANNTYITGLFNGTVDFDPGYGEYNITSRDNGLRKDIYLVKLNGNGMFQWALRFGKDGDDFPKQIAVDPYGNSYLAGWFSDAYDFDPTPEYDIHVSQGDTDAHLTKVDTYGNYQWTYTWGGYSSDKVQCLASNKNGNVTVGGEFSASVDFDPGPGEEIRIAQSSTDLFISHFDLNGDFQWVNTVYADGGVFNFAVIRHDNDGNVYAGGEFSAPIDFNPGPGIDILSGVGQGDIFLTTYSNDSGYKWTRAWGGEYLDFIFGVGIDDSGNSYVTGGFSRTIDLDPGDGVDIHTAPGESEDAMLVKLLPNGLWE